jgi:hypothetical protein
LSTATERDAGVGHAPGSPAKLTLPDWRAALKRSFTQFLKDDCMGLSQQVAYSSLLAFFPAVAFVVGAIPSWTARPTCAPRAASAPGLVKLARRGA